jgi:hypothetical protein
MNLCRKNVPDECAEWPMCRAPYTLSIASKMVEEVRQLGSVLNSGFDKAKLSGV